MKHKTRRWLNLAIVPAAAIALFAASPASAADYTDDCAGLPSSVSGNVNISDSNCVLPNSVTATGYIHISATSITGNTHTLTAQGGSVELTASSGNIDVGDLNSSWNGVILTASGTIAAKEINAGNGIELNTSGNVTTEDLTTNYGFINIDGDEVETGEIVATNGYVYIDSEHFTTEDKNITSKYALDVDVENDFDIGTGNLTSKEWYTYVDAKNIYVGDVKVETAGHILLYAKKSLKAGDIEGPNPSGDFSYNVDIQVNRDGTNSLFEIGNNSTNGVKSIKTHPKGNPQTYANSVVYVANGTGSSAGGIKLTDGSKISIDGSGSARASYLFLEANEGTLTIQGTGALTADGDAAGAGAISLQAKTITFPANAVVSASQTDSTGTLHGVVIAAETVNHNGLTLKGDGNGYDQYSNGYVQLFPKGAVTVNNNEDKMGSSIYGTIDFDTTGNITYTGSGELKMQANGDNSRVLVQAEKSTFNGGALTLESKGDENHTIQFATTGAYSGSKGVEFNGSGAISLNANAKESGDDGGNINFYVDKVTVNSPVFTVEADGPTTGDGNGGVIYLGTTNGFDISSSTVATVTADAASNGSGNAVYSDLAGYDPKAITLWAGSSAVKLGTGSGQFTFSAKGGFSGGNGGAVVVSGSHVELKTADAVHIEAPGGDGNGGGFRSFPYVTVIESSITIPIVDARGHGNGDGGKIQFYTNVSGFDPNKFFKVDGGVTSLNSAENDFGRITINDVACNQFTTGQSATWPKTYWNCIHPDESSSTDMFMPAAAQKLHTTMKTGLLGQGVQIYLMEDIEKFKTFHRVPGPTDTEGVAGYSDISRKVSAAFRWEIYSSGNKNVSSFYSGTIIHEVGHQLDENVWGIASSNNATWLTAHNGATTAFDAGFPGTCATKVDADRTDPSVGLPAICALFDGVGEPLLSNSQGLHNHGGGWFLSKSERFARSFENAYSRKFPTEIFVQIYDSKVDARLPLEQSFMNTLTTNGAPPTP